ncbi:phage major capsid protein, partial [Desulfosporosinus fructosivorans]
MANIIEMKAKRAALVDEARTILDEADKRGDGLTAEEQQKYDAIMSEVDKQGERIKREERQDQLEAEMKLVSGPTAPPDPNGAQKPASMYATEEYRNAFNSFLRTGNISLPQIQAALQADSSTAGGFIVAPERFVAQLIMGIDDLVFIRGLATVIQNADAASLGIPAMDGDMDDADWTSEIATGNLDTGLTFKKRELKPYPLAKQAKVSNKLLRAAAIDVEALIRDRLAYKFAVTQEKAFLTGDGV